MGLISTTMSMGRYSKTRLYISTNHFMSITMVYVGKDSLFDHWWTCIGHRWQQNLWTNVQRWHRWLQTCRQCMMIWFPDIVQSFFLSKDSFRAEGSTIPSTLWIMYFCWWHGWLLFCFVWCMFPSLFNHSWLITVYFEMMLSEWSEADLHDHLKNGIWIKYITCINQFVTSDDSDQQRWEDAM